MGIIQGNFGPITARSRQCPRVEGYGSFQPIKLRNHMIMRDLRDLLGYTPNLDLVQQLNGMRFLKNVTLQPTVVFAPITENKRVSDTNFLKLVKTLQECDEHILGLVIYQGRADLDGDRVAFLQKLAKQLKITLIDPTKIIQPNVFEIFPFASVAPNIIGIPNGAIMDVVSLGIFRSIRRQFDSFPEAMQHISKMGRGSVSEKILGTFLDSRGGIFSYEDYKGLIDISRDISTRVNDFYMGWSQSKLTNFILKSKTKDALIVVAPEDVVSKLKSPSAGQTRCCHADLWGKLDREGTLYSRHFAGRFKDSARLAVRIALEHKDLVGAAYMAERLSETFEIDDRELNKVVKRVS